MMEVQRIIQLLSLQYTSLISRIALVGGNHTSARFCTR
ncbi:hypothetical protein RND81_01G219500 [Saponaria officinalis]|uniref:Uncharacterized protein n=1 Tax=Saponaria officinalis TaxID=3572 RepID=A0AAW1NH84_SAPOF